MTETDLRWQLRQLPRELDLPHDLWPQIVAGIGPQQARPPRRWLAGFAIAASLLLAAGLLWRAPSTNTFAADPEVAIVKAQSRAISDEYQSALRQFDGAPLSPVYRASLQSLDRSLVEIHRAIAADPRSLFLLEQLQKTYSRRLALTQRAVTG
jgi:hypothetical protein